MSLSVMRTRIPLVLACGFFAAFAVAGPAAAQETLRGRVADGSDSPIAGAVVLLHAVTDDAGRELDRDTAAADGTFELNFTFEEGPLYFVATRVNGEIFMAEPFREVPTTEVDLRAGPGVEPLRMDGGAGGATPSPAAPASRPDEGHGIIWVLLIGAAILGIVARLVLRGRRRAPRARELLLEIARLDEARAASPAADPDAYRARREDLRARLVEALELDPHADRH